MSMSSYAAVFHEDDAGSETARLAGFAPALDGFTMRHLARLVDQAGGAVLEVGPGIGSIARLLRDRFGPRELVLLDHDPALLRRLTDLSARLITADLTDPGLPPPGQFDLIHARCVLMHLPTGLDMVRRLASWLRPGGRLVLGDLAASGDLCGDQDVTTVMNALWDAVASAIGTDRHWGRALPGALAAAGLVGIGVTVDVPILTGDDAMSRILLSSVRAVRPRMPGDAAQLDTALQRFAAVHTPTPAPLALVTAWGMRP